MIGPKCTITIQRASETSDGMGGMTVTWSDLKELKGTLLAFKRNEFFTNNVVRAISTHFFTCKYPRDVTITEKDRVSYNSDIYEITFVDNPAERNINLVLDLKKIK